MPNYEFCIGIDLGTKYSCACVWLNDKVELIPNNQGNIKTPNYISFKGCERLIGNTALNNISRNPENTIFDVKRFIGRKFSDHIFQSDMKYWPFKFVKSAENRSQIVIHFNEETKNFYAEELLAMILLKMKENVRITSVHW